MDWQCFLAFIIPLLLFKSCSVRFCSTTSRLHGKPVKIQHCCINFVLKNGQCEECPIGFTTKDRKDNECKECQHNHYGHKCLAECFCKENERCHHEKGCVLNSDGVMSLKSTIPNKDDTASETACPIGYTSENNHCRQCKIGFYGEKCTLDCFCLANERCDNEYGCINTTTKNTGDINTKFENKESIIYIGCVGLLTFVVIILLTYICCIRTRKKTAFENAEPKHRNAITSAEKHVLHWTSDKNMIDETLYDEIDDNFLCDIKANEEHKMIADEDDDSNQSTKDVNDGYLNPYQPIISTEVDVHQYSSTKNEDDNSTTSDENQRDSGYLHPYQSLKSDISETKHEYTGLETNEYRYTRNQHGEEIIATEMGAQ